MSWLAGYLEETEVVQTIARQCWRKKIIELEKMLEDSVSSKAYSPEGFLLMFNPPY